MSFCANQILELAQGTWEDLNGPTAISVGYISGWYTQSGHLGALNNQLTTCMYLSGDAPCIVGMGAEEASIYALTYLNGYYKGLSSNVLAQGSLSWTRLREGDSTIERESSVQIAKAATAIWQESNKQLRLAIQDYKRAQSIPGVIDSATLNSWPSP